MELKSIQSHKVIAMLSSVPIQWYKVKGHGLDTFDTKSITTNWLRTQSFNKQQQLLMQVTKVIPPVYGLCIREQNVLREEIEASKELIISTFNLDNCCVSEDSLV